MPKTKRVRIAVAIDSTGTWCASGQSIEDGDPCPDDEMAAEVLEGDLIINASKMVHFVEAEIPIPEEVTVEGHVSGGGG
jgi:hypothetical protein